jgi:hypothetical protein
MKGGLFHLIGGLVIVPPLCRVMNWASVSTAEKFRAPILNFSRTMGSGSMPWTHSMLRTFVRKVADPESQLSTEMAVAIGFCGTLPRGTEAAATRSVKLLGFCHTGQKR